MITAYKISTVFLGFSTRHLHTRSKLHGRAWAFRSVKSRFVASAALEQKSRLNSHLILYLISGRRRRSKNSVRMEAAGCLALSFLRKQQMWRRRKKRYASLPVSHTWAINRNNTRSFYLLATCQISSKAWNILRGLPRVVSISVFHSTISPSEHALAQVPSQWQTSFPVNDLFRVCMNIIISISKVPIRIYPLNEIKLWSCDPSKTLPPFRHRW